MGSSEGGLWLPSARIPPSVSGQDAVEEDTILMTNLASSINSLVWSAIHLLAVALDHST